MLIVFVGRQLENRRLLYLYLLETVGIANDAVAAQCPCRDGAAFRLAVVGVLQQDADDLNTEPFFELLVADAFTQVGVDLNDTLSHTDVALHLSVFCHPMGAESREQGFFAEEPAFGNLGYSF
jgi:hypothetical protein